MSALAAADLTREESAVFAAHRRSTREAGETPTTEAGGVAPASGATSFLGMRRR